MFVTILFFIIIFHIILVIVTAEQALKTGRSLFFWASVVFFFGIFGFVLFVYDLSRHPQDLSTETKTSLRITCDVIDGNGKEKRVSMVIRSNSTVEATQKFKESCASKGMVLTEEPSVNIE